jgi:hypothetical protein
VSQGHHKSKFKTGKTTKTNAGISLFLFLYSSFHSDCTLRFLDGIDSNDACDSCCTLDSVLLLVVVSDRASVAGWHDSDWQTECMEYDDSVCLRKLDNTLLAFDGSRMCGYAFQNASPMRSSCTRVHSIF